MVYAAHQPQYIPWLGFFDKMARADVFVFLDTVQYKHREFQNRNKIRTKDGVQWLTVPVHYKQGIALRDVRIDNGRDWRAQHLKSLKAWYGRAPFFDAEIGFFESLYALGWERLMDLNVATIRFFCERFGIATRTVLESELGTSGAKTQRLVDIGRALGAATYLSGAGGRAYLEEGLFRAAGQRVVYQEFAHPRYAQLFAERDEDFVPCLSAVDLLFNEGPGGAALFKK
ncbi:MAG: WbqC family protein [Deltaproteobacteria bacterium]